MLVSALAAPSLPCLSGLPPLGGAPEAGAAPDFALLLAALAVPALSRTPAPRMADAAEPPAPATARDGEVPDRDDKPPTAPEAPVFGFLPAPILPADPPQPPPQPAEAVAAAGAAQGVVAPPPSSPGPESAPPPLDITQPDWPAQLAARLRGDTGPVDAMSGTDITLEVSPETLGPLRLRITVEGDGARISILAGSDDAARLLQASRPELERSLADAGFSLAGDGAQDRRGAPPPQLTPDRTAALVARRPLPALAPQGSGSALNLIA
ncbi:MAG: flagellar hook-length control protein FliK [Gemmobacter sp.]|nr:flagellar hook-length control protein FliK [Gemmobacter sp.]